MSRAYTVPNGNPLTNGAIGDVCFAGFEPQSVAAVFDSLNGTDSSGIDTATPITGAASFLWDRAAGSSAEAFRYMTGVFGSELIAGACFAIELLTAPPSDKYIGFHAMNAALVYNGVGFYVDGSGNPHIALISGDSTLTIPYVPWHSTTVLSGVHRICWRHWRTTQGIGATDEWMGDLVLMDSSGAILERSGPTRMYTPTAAPGSLINPSFGGWSNGANGAIASACKYRMDDFVPTKGGWPPLYAKVIKQTPATSEGTDTAWTLAAGDPSPNEWSAVDEAPNDGDTTRINRLSTGSNSQSYALSASGISLGADEKILGECVYCAVSYSGGTAPIMTARSRVNGALKTGGAMNPPSSPNYGYSRCVFTPPFGGWSVADVDASEAGINTSSGTTTDRRCSQIIKEVAYGKDFYDNLADWHQPPAQQPNTVRMVGV